MATETMMFAPLGAIALYALMSAIVGYVRHVRRHRARFAAIVAEVADLQASARERDHSRRRALVRADGPHKFVAGAGCPPPETPVLATSHEVTP
ncbi:hypothetical protein [Actinocrispum wychmicini]|uniref:Uncharacterized protein n=1 Tax=Actinocrispum wychmicini TaxID=1213861 RepID=A0A4R2JVF7_9PSEU|nr:hypothetical protein [Actinocrispum wychmicini]TCO64403.1 hypothetical protein EV192_101171 [Actinocrispum wychmicini]